MSGVGTLQELKDYVMDVVASIGADFAKPDDDWMMVAVMEDRNGEMHLAPLDQMMGSEWSKEMLAQTIRAYLTEKQIVNYAFLFNVHGIAYASKEEMEKREQERDGRRIQTLPDAVEMLMLVVGNSAVETLYEAQIIRDDQNPPTLGEWKEVDKLGGRFSGFNEAIRPIEI